jgi:hypothetical protein
LRNCFEHRRWQCNALAKRGANCAEPNATSGTADQPGDKRSKAESLRGKHPE